MIQMRKVMRVLRKSSSSSESGAAAVEFAIVVPVLLLLLFAIFDYGRFFLVQMALTSGAQEGVRASVLGQTLSSVSTTALNPVSNEVVQLGVLGDIATCSAGTMNYQDCVTRTAVLCASNPATGVGEVNLTLSFTWIATGALWFFIAPDQPQTVSATAKARCNG
jgi:Flp pilus assembly protein TadG